MRRQRLRATVPTGYRRIAGHRTTCPGHALPNCRMPARTRAGVTRARWSNEGFDEHVAFISLAPIPGSGSCSPHAAPPPADSPASWHPKACLCADNWTTDDRQDSQGKDIIVSSSNCILPRAALVTGPSYAIPCLGFDSHGSRPQKENREEITSWLLAQPCTVPPRPHRHTGCTEALTPDNLRTRLWLLGPGGKGVAWSLAGVLHDEASPSRQYHQGSSTLKRQSCCTSPLPSGYWATGMHMYRGH